MPLRIISLILLFAAAILLILKGMALCNFFPAVLDFGRLEPLENQESAGPGDGAVTTDYLLMTLGLGLGLLTLSVLFFTQQSTAIVGPLRMVGIGSGVLMLAAGIVLFLGLNQLNRGFSILGIGSPDRVVEDIMQHVTPQIQIGAVLLSVALLGAGSVIAFGAKAGAKKLPVFLPIIFACLSMGALLMIGQGNLHLAELLSQGPEEGYSASRLASGMSAILSGEWLGAIGIMLLGITTALSFFLWPFEEA